MAIYYAATHLSQLQELWVKTGHESYMPIHLIAKSLGPSLCKMLPFIHSISGRDITSSLFFIGKKSWLIKSKQIATDALSNFGEDSYEISFMTTATHTQT